MSVDRQLALVTCATAAYVSATGSDEWRTALCFALGWLGSALWLRGRLRP